MGSSSPPAVTCRSCIASSSAAWVLGGVRLISSASMMLAKIGPAMNAKPAAAGLEVVLQHVGAGDVRRHHVGGELDPPERQAQDPRDRADQECLGQPRHPHEQDVAAGEEPGQQLLDHVVLADDHLADLVRSRR